MIIILMGVSGSGKTTVGRLLAHRLGWSFVDGDDLHPEDNVMKMSAGQPLDAADRRQTSTGRRLRSLILSSDLPLPPLISQYR